MERAASTGLTRTGYRFVAVITGLSVAHQVDHVLRDVTGWPFAGGFNAFSASLFVYPVIAAGVVMSRRRKVGPRSESTAHDYHLRPGILPLHDCPLGTVRA